MRPCPVQMLEPSMDTCRAPMSKPDHAVDDADDDSDELGVFAAERYFYGDDDDALWPWERSSSSLSSSAFRTGTQYDHDRSAPTPTAVTSSSEASWNSRSALLPNESPADKLHAVAVAVAATTPIIEASASGSGAEARSAGRRPASSSNQMRRWLLGVAACACAGGASEDSVSAADEMETSERFPETTEIPDATAARSSVTPASGRWLLQGDKATLAGIVDGHRGATNKGELSTPVLHPQAAATSDSDERRRIKSLEMFRPVPPVGDHGSALGPAMQSSAFTIVAGNKAPGGDGDAPRAASGGGGSPGGEDDAAPSELGCAYPPSEASVVWSVVTADGAASGNFSSAASGYHYHYHYCFNDVDGAAARNTHKRRSGIAGGSNLLMCMREKAVDAVGPARSVNRQEVQPPAMPTLGASGGRKPERPWSVQAYQDTIRRW